MGTYLDMRDHLIESKATEGNSKINNLIERYKIELYKVMNDDEAILDLKGDFLIECFCLLKDEGYELEDTSYISGRDDPVKKITDDILIMAEQAGCKKAVLNSGLLVKLKSDKELYESKKIKNYLGILGNM